jgi:coenzyme F420 hydrogenase subunit beta
VLSVKNELEYRFYPVPRKYKNLKSESLPFDIGENVSFVPRLGLCTMCGVCEGVCPENAIVMSLNNAKGIIEPVVDATLCTQCSLCVDVCPGFELDTDRHLSDEKKRSLKKSLHFGFYKKTIRAKAAESLVSSNGASGGTATAILKYLLLTGRVDGVVTTRMHSSHPLETEVFIARKPEDLLIAQKSKYLPNPMGTILKNIVGGEFSNQRLAWIGLPCHVEGIRLAQEAIPVLKERIPFVFSIFCSRCPTLHATKYLMNVNRVNEGDLEKVEYRSGEHPGYLTFLMKDGTRRCVPHLHQSYWGYAFLQFFYPTRCFVCFDKTGEQADASFGDNWQHLRDDSEGASSIIVRNEETNKIITEMRNKNYLVITNELTEQEFVRDQDLIKKHNLGDRISLLQLFGRKVPIYYNNYPVVKSDLLRTFRLVRHVFMAEHDVPPKLMQLYIFLSSGKRRFIKIIKRQFNMLVMNLRGINNQVSHVIHLLEIFLPAVEKHQPLGPKNGILMLGGYGWKDVGDEAMPRTDIVNIKKLCPDIGIVMLSPDPTYTTEHHGQKAIKDLKCLGYSSAWPFLARIKARIVRNIFLLGALAQRFGYRMRLWADVRQVLDEMSICSVVLNVGGGNLNSIMPKELHKKCTIYLAAKYLNKPVILSGQTIGPFSNAYDVKAARRALNKVLLITLRDKAVSMERLFSIGVKKPKMFDAADDAMKLPFVGNDDALKMLIEEAPKEWFSDTGKFTVAMNFKGSLQLFKGEGRSGSCHNEINTMAQIADALIENHDARIYFVPTDYSIGVDDRELHKEIHSRMARKEEAICIEGEYDESALKGFVGVADLAVGSRYHFNVFAASSYIPFAGVASGKYQQTKLKGLAELCGTPDCFIEEDLEYVNFGIVWEKIEKVIKNRIKIASILRSQVPILEEKSVAGVKMAIELSECSERT